MCIAFQKLINGSGDPSILRMSYFLPSNLVLILLEARPVNLLVRLWSRCDSKLYKNFDKGPSPILLRFSSLLCK